MIFSLSNNLSGVYRNGTTSLSFLEIDIANSTINVTADSFVGGSADAGVGYTTTSSY